MGGMITRAERNDGDKVLLNHKPRIKSVMKDREQTDQMQGQSRVPEERIGGDKVLANQKRRVEIVMKDRWQTKQPEERNCGDRVLPTRRGKGHAGFTLQSCAWLR